MGDGGKGAGLRKLGREPGSESSAFGFIYSEAAKFIYEIFFQSSYLSREYYCLTWFFTLFTKNFFIKAFFVETKRKGVARSRGDKLKLLGL